MGFLGESAPPASRLRLPNGGWHTASGRILGVSIAEAPKGIPIIPVLNMGLSKKYFNDQASREIQDFLAEPENWGRKMGFE